MPGEPTVYDEPPLSAFGLPDPDDPYAGVADSVVHDVFRDTAGLLIGEYARLALGAADGPEQERWHALSARVHDRRSAVPADDRAALLGHIEHWRAELGGLRGR
jgi:hypothetical protein